LSYFLCFRLSVCLFVCLFLFLYYIIIFSVLAPFVLFFFVIIYFSSFFSSLLLQLPQFTLIEPRMGTKSPTEVSNWQHPDNSVEAGEKLLQDVYQSLQKSQYWEDTALIITYDEHGGFFDHVPTPVTGVPAPDNVPGENGFDYSRLGVRIPTVVCFKAPPSLPPLPCSSGQKTTTKILL
jgi:hypothetical protein